MLMNSYNMTELSIADGDRVNIENETGKMENISVKSYPLLRGNAATFFPGSNVLIPAETDPQSKTPVYKSVKVSIIPAKNNSEFQTAEVINAD